MGRPKKECPLSNAERKRRWQEKHQDSHEEMQKDDKNMQRELWDYPKKI